MPVSSQLLITRQRRRGKDQNAALRHSGLGCATLICLAVVILVMGLASYYVALSRDLPSLQILASLLEPPNGLYLQPTRFYDRSGEHVIYTLQNPAISEKRYLPLENQDNPQSDGFLSPALVTATIATADPGFWTNPGYALRGIRQNEHSTIAQRIVAESLTWDDPPGFRQGLRERLLAAQITHQFGRQKIMEWYLNSAYYGNLAYGAEAAAQIYFGKSATDLTLAEAAVLAGVAEAPAINPISAPDTALERQQIVIDAMLGQGLITPEEAVQARNAPVIFNESIPPETNLAPAFLDLVWDQITTFIPRERLERGGFEIITTLDYDLQLQTTCAMEVHLSRLQGENQEILTADHQPCEASLLLPTFTLTGESAQNNVTANVVIVNPASGEVLAMAGSEGPGKATSYQDSHSAGTLLAPFIYLTAFTRGFSPASLVWDIHQDWVGIPPEAFNPGGEFHGPIRLREALANDYIVPALQIVNQIGSENILQISHQLGLNSLTYSPSDSSNLACLGCPLLFGRSQISLLEAVQAFGVFPNQGVLAGQTAGQSAENGLASLQPIAILNVRDLNGQVWISNPDLATRPVISPQLAYLMIDTLSDEAVRWPSLGHPNPLEIGRPAGAKLGWTLQGQDAWTLGFTPQMVVGVWMGSGDSDSPAGGDLSPKSAAALWHAVIQYASRELPASGWEMPPGISQMDVCDPSGMLPTTQCHTVVSEVFLSGQEPTQPDTLYQSYKINRETGRLATVFTPLELIEERTYLNIPAEASAWAESAGLPAPPDTYDVIYTPVVLTNTQITSPQMFANVKGQVSILGTATGEDFESYRLQIGQGINPSGWIVIQEDKLQPVENGILGAWDTSDANGLYALQLVILRQNQRVETATIQVTVDNLNPEISILYPQNGQTIPRDSGSTITLQTQIQDNLGIAHVEFYVDDLLVSTQTLAPFAVPWRASPGEHTFRVKAIDLAGNLSEVTISFVVN